MAAGLGFKDFVTGEVLTAADVDGYLMQGIWVFADATARDAAVTSPQEGNSCYLKDTDVIQVYSGSSWVTKSGGSPLTTKGDLYTFSTTDARLAVGANDTVLTADSSEATGLKWATPAAGGMTLINTGGTTLTGSSVTISSIPATYIDLYLVIRNPRPASDAVSVNMRVNSDSNNRYTETAGGSAGPATFPNSSWTIATSLDDGVGQSLITVRIFDYANTTTWKMAANQTINNDYTTPTSFNAIRYMQFYNQTDAIDSITLFNSAPNWTSGTAYLYGVK